MFRTPLRNLILFGEAIKRITYSKVNHELQTAFSMKNTWKESSKTGNVSMQNIMMESKIIANEKIARHFAEKDELGNSNNSQIFRKVLFLGSSSASPSSFSSSPFSSSSARAASSFCFCISSVNWKKFSSSTKIFMGTWRGRSINPPDW